MRSNWTSIRLEECFVLENGYAFKSKDFIETGIPVIKIKNVKAGYFVDNNFSYVDERFIDEKPSKVAKKNDVLITMSGNRHDGNPETWVGKVALFTKEEQYLINQRVGALRLKDGIDVDPIFVAYALSAWKYQNWFISIANSSGGQANISPNQILSTSILLPPIGEQKAIAHILSSLDDKIELNRQINETLEAMAQALFKSWFVDFDPVIDNALLAGNDIPDELAERAELRQAQLDSGKAHTDSEINDLFPSEFEFTEELGWMPKGWSVDSLDQLCSTITDGSHSSPKSVNEGYPMASVKDMNNWGFNLDTCRIISETDYLKLKKNGCQPLKNDVLIAKDGSYLKHIFVMEDDLELVTLSSIAILRPNLRINPHFLKFTLKREDVHRRMENYVSGAVIQRIVLRDFRKFEIVVPPESLQSHWFEITRGIFESCWNNIHQNETLTKLRDTLLPKLMSGELRIPDAEKLVEDI